MPKNGSKSDKDLRIRQKGKDSLKQGKLYFNTTAKTNNK